MACRCALACFKGPLVTYGWAMGESDRHVVDAAMNHIGSSTVFLSGAIKKMQSGHMQLYIWFFTSGALLLTLIMLYLNY